MNTNTQISLISRISAKEPTEAQAAAILAILDAPSGCAPREQMLTTSEIRREFRVSLRTLLRFIHSGELRAVRIGRQFRIPASAVYALLNK